MGQCYTKKDKDSIITSENPIDSSSTSPTELKTCSICLDEISPLHQFTIPNCRHQFHRKCIAEWNKKSQDCPNCRGPIIKVSDFVSQFLIETERIRRENENNHGFATFNRNRYNSVVLRSRRIIVYEN